MLWASFIVVSNKPTVSKWWININIYWTDENKHFIKYCMSLEKCLHYAKEILNFYYQSDETVICFRLYQDEVQYLLKKNLLSTMWMRIYMNHMKTYVYNIYRKLLNIFKSGRKKIILRYSPMTMWEKSWKFSPTYLFKVTLRTHLAIHKK